MIEGASGRNIKLAEMQVFYFNSTSASSLQDHDECIYH